MNNKTAAIEIKNIMIEHADAIKNNIVENKKQTTSQKKISLSVKKNSLRKKK